MASGSFDHQLVQGSRSVRLASAAVLAVIEARLSAHLGRAWQVRSFRDMHHYASHPAAVLSDGAYPVFVKLSEAAHALDQFEVEQAGLRLLAERAGVLVPAPIDILQIENGVILILEGMREVERTPERWREIGRTLARVHLVQGESCGLERQGYFGPLYLDNRPLADWLTFFTERRLWPYLIGAIDSGHLPTAVIRQVEGLIARLPALDIPESSPVLLHGDAQKNNFISTASGAVVIDPAVYYGSPELDLAYIDTFEPVPEDVFLGYQEIRPIAPGFSTRRDLWRIPAYLAAVTVEGQPHLHKLVDALQKYQ